MKIVRDIQSKNVTLMFSDEDSMELLPTGLYVNRMGFLHITSDTHEVVDGPLPEVWVQGDVLRFSDDVWSVVDQARYDEAQAERRALKASEVRAERNRRLSETDWTQVADAPVDQAAWATYRQALRDITAQEGFPWDVQWPQMPA